MSGSAGPDPAGSAGPDPAGSAGPDPAGSERSDPSEPGDAGYFPRILSIRALMKGPNSSRKIVTVSINEIGRP